MTARELSFDDSSEATETEVTSTNNILMNSESWINTKRVPIKPPIPCVVPVGIVLVLRTMDEELSKKQMGTCEYSLFLKGTFVDNKLIISNDYFLPEQIVTGSSVDFKESPPEGFNGVIHKHPPGCMRFSSTDEKHINSNFEFSILYTDAKIVDGIINIDLKGYRLQLPLSIKTEWPRAEVIPNVDKIVKYQHPQTQILGGPTVQKNDQLCFPSVASPEDDDNYICDKCQMPTFIDSFPTLCPNCNEILEEEDVTEIEKDDEDVQNTYANRSIKNNGGSMTRPFNDF